MSSVFGVHMLAGGGSLGVVIDLSTAQVQCSPVDGADSTSLVIMWFKCLE